MKALQDYIKYQLHEELCNAYEYIDEGGGIYDGQIELAKYITELIYNKRKKNVYDYSFVITYDELNDFRNVIFNKMIVNVHIINSNQMMSNVILYKKYDNYKDIDEYEKYNYDKTYNRLNEITLNLYCGNFFDMYSFEKKIIGRISHELNHTYTYWNILKDDFNNDKIFDNKTDKFIDNYHNALHKYTDECYVKITEIIDNQGKFFIDHYDRYLTDEEKKKIVSSYFLLYSLTRYERNAFLVEIVSYIFDNKSVIIDPYKVEEKIEQCEQYKLYSVETDIMLDKIEREWSNEDKKFLIDAYKYVYGNEYTVNRILKLLRFKLKQTLNKLNRNIITLTKKYYNDSLNETAFDYNINYPLSFNDVQIDDEIDWF